MAPKDQYQATGEIQEMALEPPARRRVQEPLRAAVRGPHPGRRVGRRRVGESSLPSFLAKISLRTGVLLSPVATKQTRSEFWRVDSVNVTRSEGGFGESRMQRATLPSGFRNKSCSGNNDAVWPSGPMPSRQRSKRLPTALSASPYFSAACAGARDVSSV